MLPGGLLLVSLMTQGPLASAQNVLVNAQVEDLGFATDRLNRVIANPTLTHEQVSDKDAQYVRGLEEAGVRLNFQAHPWATAPAADKALGVKEILSAGEERLDNARHSPEGEVLAAKRQAREMFDAGKINFGSLAENQAGVYNYKQPSPELGVIELNDRTAQLALVIPPFILYSTAIHEAQHAMSHQKGELTTQEVKKGERIAFKTQCQYLHAVTKRGEEIASAIKKIEAALKTERSPILKTALDYTWSQVWLYETNCEDGKLDQYVDKMGYQEKGERAKTSPFSS